MRSATRLIGAAMNLYQIGHSARITRRVRKRTMQAIAAISLVLNVFISLFFYTYIQIELYQKSHPCGVAREMLCFDNSCEEAFGWNIKRS